LEYGNSLPLFFAAERLLTMSSSVKRVLRGSRPIAAAGIASVWFFLLIGLRTPGNGVGQGLVALEIC
jgi:hypothetical protein